MNLNLRNIKFITITFLFTFCLAPFFLVEKGNCQFEIVNYTTVYSDLCLKNLCQIRCFKHFKLDDECFLNCSLYGDDLCSIKHYVNIQYFYNEIPIKNGTHRVERYWNIDLSNQTCWINRKSLYFQTNMFEVWFEKERMYYFISCILLVMFAMELLLIEYLMKT